MAKRVVAVKTTIKSATITHSAANAVWLSRSRVSAMRHGEPLSPSPARAMAPQTSVVSTAAAIQVSVCTSLEPYAGVDRRVERVGHEAAADHEHAGDDDGRAEERIVARADRFDGE